MRQALTLFAGICVVFLFSSGSAGAQQPAPGEEFAAAFHEYYTVVTDRAAAAAPARVSHSFAFTSRVGTPGAAGTTFLRFRLRVDEFEDSAAAQRALRGLAAKLRGDQFVKWPLLACATGPRLYRLDGSCLYAEPQWQMIEQRLLGSLFPAGERPCAPLLRIACGGAVLDAPAPPTGTSSTDQ